MSPAPDYAESFSGFFEDIILALVLALISLGQINGPAVQL